jgi:hypothetical protein
MCSRRSLLTPAVQKKNTLEQSFSPQVRGALRGRDISCPYNEIGAHPVCHDCVIKRGDENDSALKLRNTTRVLAPGKIESDEYSAMAGAPETLLVHVEAKKR